MTPEDKDAIEKMIAAKIAEVQFLLDAQANSIASLQACNWAHCKVLEDLAPHLAGDAAQEALKCYDAHLKKCLTLVVPAQSS
jgi:hypothetical protein